MMEQLNRENKVNILKRNHIAKTVTVISLLLIVSLFYESSVNDSINYVRSNISGKLRIYSQARIRQGK